MKNCIFFSISSSKSFVLSLTNLSSFLTSYLDFITNNIAISIYINIARELLQKGGFIVNVTLLASLLFPPVSITLTSKVYFPGDNSLNVT